MPRWHVPLFLVGYMNSQSSNDEIIKSKEKNMLRKEKTKLEKEEKIKKDAAEALYHQNERNIQISRVVESFPILTGKDLLSLSTERINEIADDIEDKIRGKIK